MSDVAEIAGKLTEAQRRWLLSAKPTTEPVTVVPSADWWDNPPALYVTIDDEDIWLGSRSMRSPEGCSTFTTGCEQLTPMALAVREHLQSPKGQGLNTCIDAS